MTPEERDALAAKADRAMRRGELSAAVALYQQLAAAFPQERTWAEKLGHLNESVQPVELRSPKGAPAASSSSPLDVAEAEATSGNFPKAIALYRTALAAQPNSQLLKERLAELFELAQAQSRRPAPLPPRPPEVTLTLLLDRISSRRKA